MKKVAITQEEHERKFHDLEPLPTQVLQLLLEGSVLILRTRPAVLQVEVV